MDMKQASATFLLVFFMAGCGNEVTSFFTSDDKLSTKVGTRDPNGVIHA